MTKLYYEGILRDEDTDEVIIKIGGYSMESLEEELGKMEKAAIKYEEEKLEEEKEIMEFTVESVKTPNEETDFIGERKAEILADNK